MRQAAFWVLLKTACPSILFEMGFISNPEEERFLNQPASIAQMANAIVNAFGAYTHKQAVRQELFLLFFGFNFPQRREYLLANQ